jgi:hypothetical protein
MPFVVTDKVDERIVRLQSYMMTKGFSKYDNYVGGFVKYGWFNKVKVAISFVPNDDTFDPDKIRSGVLHYRGVPLKEIFEIGTYMENVFNLPENAIEIRENRWLYDHSFNF